MADSQQTYSERRVPRGSRRIPGATGRLLRVILGATAAFLFGLSISLWSGSGVQLSVASAEESPDLARSLREIGRAELALDQRLRSAGLVLGSKAPVDPEACYRAALSLVEEAPVPACWLLLRGGDAGWIPAEDRAQALARIEGAIASRRAAGSAVSPALVATAWLLGRRTGAAIPLLVGAREESALVRAVLGRELGHAGATADADLLAELLKQSAPVAALLDEATCDDADRIHAALDGLLKMGPQALPVLLHEAGIGASGDPAGRMPRACRAILVLGMLKNRAATQVLSECLRSSDGWVRVHAAQALGDLGDPAGAVALAELLATLGDPHRPRDSWDYPGASGTTVSESDWPNVDYFVIDCAAADSLMRLGCPRAAGYVIQQKLDPGKGNFRIRVYQDAVDALRRSLPDAQALIAAYNVDTGLPQREAAFMALADWWHANQDKQDLLRGPLDETDESYRTAAQSLVNRLTGKDVRQFMITKPACALLGSAVTPTLIETVGTATRGAALAELAKTLGLVRDPRAVPTLLGLLSDSRPFVRAAAAEALGAYAGESRVRAALVQMLSDRKEGPRVSAMAGLLGAPPTPAVLDAIRAATPQNPSVNQAMALHVLLLVQEGDAHWQAVREGLNAKHRYERESWWGLVQRALDLPDYVHDAAATPDAPNVRRLELERVRRARAARKAR